MGLGFQKGESVMAVATNGLRWLQQLRTNGLGLKIFAGRRTWIRPHCRQKNGGGKEGGRKTSAGVLVWVRERGFWFG